MTNDWKARTEAYKAKLLDSIPKEWRLPADYKLGKDVRFVAEQSGILTKDEVELMARDATQLAQDIANKKYTAVQVATAYCKGAAVAHQTTNCLMDFFPDVALERARWLDAELERTGKPVGPLHGVPISVKDMCGLKGSRMSAGYLGILESEDGVQKADCTVVATFRKAGAIFYCKTTNPQAIMHLETNCFLGETLNPYNTDLTPGGSSGGESALIAAGGSVLGIGTDIGGSIRNPCANCGLYGLKGGSFRLPRLGNVSGMPSQESITGALGPMAVSARDCELFVKVVLDDEPWRIDSTSAKMPWRPEEVKWVGGKDKPRIGVMYNDGVVIPQPPMRQALEEAVAKLKAAGFEVVEFKQHKAKESWALLKQLYFTDGGRHVRQQAARTGEPILALTEWIMEGAKDCTANEVMELVKQREAFRAEYARYWNEQNIDVLLCPPMPGPANVRCTSKYWGYTSFWNLVDYPGAVFPTGIQVDPKNPAQAADKPREYLSEADKMVAEAYNPETFANAPIDLQVVAARWEDERCLEGMKLISQIVNP